MSSYMSAETCRRIVAERSAWTSEQHLEAAADLLAGSYERDNVPFTPYTYSWVPPTAADAARAQAHATLALAIATRGRARVAGWSEPSRPDEVVIEEPLPEPAEPQSWGRWAWRRRSGAR